MYRMIRKSEDFILASEGNYSGAVEQLTLELAEYKDAIMAAMLKGTKRHVESMPEKNEKGNAQTGQSHQK